MLRSDDICHVDSQLLCRWGRQSREVSYGSECEIGLQEQLRFLQVKIEWEGGHSQWKEAEGPKQVDSGNYVGTSSDIFWAHIEAWLILNALGLGVRHWLIDWLIDYKELAHLLMMEADKSRDLQGELANWSTCVVPVWVQRPETRRANGVVSVWRPAGLRPRGADVSARVQSQGKKKMNI